MKRGLGKKVLTLSAMLLFAISFMPGLAAADKLELRNGQVWEGKYLGGTEDTIRFRVGDQMQTFHTSDVLKLTFNAEGTAAPASSASAMPRATGTVTVPAGTPIVVRMIDSVDSKQNNVGDIFRASLDEPLVVNSRVVAPKGADVEGRLAQAKEAGRISGKSELELELTALTIDGHRYAISSGNYEVAGQGRGKRSAEVIGGGAALGAIIGAIAGGGKGAAIGAATGAGAGTAIQVLTKGEQVRVPSETRLSFELNRPLVVNLR